MLRALAFLSLAAALAGCEAGPLPTEAAPQAPTPQLAQPVQKAIDVAEVRWPERARIDARVRDALPAEARAEVDRSRLPVLTPRRLGLVDQARVVVRPQFTAVSMPGAGASEGLTVSLHTTKVAHRHAHLPVVHGRDVVRGADAWITENEGIWSASWTEHGVSYVLEVECARPAEDARCASDALVRELAEELAFVGGSFEGGAK